MSVQVRALTFISTALALAFASCQSSSGGQHEGSPDAGANARIPPGHDPPSDTPTPSGGAAGQPPDDQVPNAGGDAGNPSGGNASGGNASGGNASGSGGNASGSGGNASGSGGNASGSGGNPSGGNPSGGSGGNGACDPQKPFGPAISLPGLPNEVKIYLEAQLSPDELTAYYSRSRGSVGGYDIYFATRSALGAPFTTAGIVAGVNSTANDVGPSLSDDGLSIFFYSDVGRSLSSHQLYTATRSAPAGDFGAPTALAALNSGTFIDTSPFVVGNGRTLYFASFRSGNGDLYFADQAAGGFAAPARVPTVNTASLELHPVVSPDQRTIYWSSDRTDGGAKGDFDIWTATRPSASAPFGAAKNVAELNTAGAEIANWVSPDGCRLYFGQTPENLDLRTVMVAERSR